MRQFKSRMNEFPVPPGINPSGIFLLSPLSSMPFKNSCIVPSPPIIHTQSYLLKLKNILDLQKSELIILVYPWPGQIYRNDKISLQVKVWKEWAKNNNVKFINLFPLFFEDNQSENDRLKVIEKFYFYFDMHFNENGHKIVADYLWKELSINPH